MCGGGCHFDFEINSHTFNRLNLGLDLVAQNIHAQKDGAGDQNDDVVQHQHHGHLNALLHSISGVYCLFPIPKCELCKLTFTK